LIRFFLAFGKILLFLTQIVDNMIIEQIYMNLVYLLPIP